MGCMPPVFFQDLFLFDTGGFDCVPQQKCAGHVAQANDVAVSGMAITCLSKWLHTLINAAFPLRSAQDDQVSTRNVPYTHFGD